MTTAAADNLQVNQANHKRYELWAAWVLYLLMLSLSISRHELWGDELHSWNIARSSTGLADLLANTRYEGHPPLWYGLLFILSKLTQDPWAIQPLHVCICALTAFIFLFRCRLSLMYKLPVLFGYYFLYEYATLSRNYAPGILLAFVICTVINSSLEHKLPLYYLLLLLLANTHFLAFIMACSFHACYIWPLFKSFTIRMKVLHLACSIAALMPALYFIFPPGNSGLDLAFWLQLWNRQHLAMALQAPLKALSPVPAWWEAHWWNTQAWLQLHRSYAFLKYITPFLSLGLLALCVFVLRPYAAALRFFILNLVLTLGFALVFPLNSARYVGFIFIGFVVALWLSNAEQFSTGRRTVLCLLLLLQLAGSIIAVKKDWQLPFTQVRAIRHISALVPGGDELITDYWCLNYATAFLNRPVYCLGFDRERSFLLWDREMMRVSKQRNMYTNGVAAYFEQRKKQSVYFLANTPKADMAGRDSLFFKTFNVALVAARDSAIEAYSNIYLYKISPRPKR